MTFKIKLEPKKEVEPIKVITDEYELWLGDCLELMKDNRGVILLKSNISV